MQADGRGGFHYIAGGFQNQFGVETHIIAGICMIIWLNKTDCRWSIGFRDNGSCVKSTYNTRSYKPIYRYMGMECGDSIHLLILDVCLPYQEWRLSIQVISLGKVNI